MSVMKVKLKSTGLFIARDIAGDKTLLMYLVISVVLVALIFDSSHSHFHIRSSMTSWPHLS